MTPRARFMLFVFFGLLVAACGDPVHDQQRSRLGPETHGVPRGPLHRPGQPCLVCHGAQGPSSFEMSFGGTVYQTNLGRVPARSVLVTLTDADLRRYSVLTNCAGNFYIQPADFTPVYPVKVFLSYSGLKIPQMNTSIYRDGSCATCHTDPPGPTSAGHISLARLTVADGGAPPSLGAPLMGCP